MNQEKIALDLQGLNKIYSSDILKANTKVVTDLNIKFAEGKCTGLLGHNGAGKTTTIKIIFGLVRQDSGQVKVFGEPYTQKLKAKLGYMPEISKLPKSLRVSETIFLQNSLYRSHSKQTKSESKEIIHQLIQQSGLWDHRHKKISDLSKGLARRVSWCCAVSHNPKIVILDEPYGGLDPIGRRDMSAWIEELKSQNKTIILCTHEIEAILNRCDVVNIMKMGRLAFQGPTINSDGQKISQDQILSYFGG